MTGCASWAHTLTKQADDSRVFRVDSQPCVEHREHFYKGLLEQPWAQGRVINLGFVSNLQLFMLIKAAEALVFPSMYEGFGIPVLEAMSIGTPVIASNLAVMREWFGDCYEPFRNIRDSWAMAEDYGRTYGVKGVPVIASHDATLSAPAAQALRNRDEVVIGMAGQFYANEEWFQLITALNYVGWKVAGRRVRLKVLGHQEPSGEIPPGHLDFVGWKPQIEAIRILSQETDLLYCPYPFSPAMGEVSRLSFPSKLPLYFAAGRPVLMHGPRYSSPARYLLETGAGVLCLDLDPPAVYNALQRMVEDRDLYQTTAEKGHDAFLRDFSHARMNKSVSEFLGDLA